MCNLQQTSLGDLITVKEAATIIGIQTDTLRNYLSIGKLPIRRIKIGSATMLHKQEVKNYAAQRNANGRS
jgi:excisionase family DNA binding protein